MLIFIILSKIDFRIKFYLSQFFGGINRIKFLTVELNSIIM
nr:MAG TPA: hypothetical protein [Caudoviricetes sp.]